VAIIETADDRFVFTMHIRSPHPGTDYQVRAQISYADIGVVDTQTTVFTLPPPAEEEI
jgi:hypothetical protein